MERASRRRPRNRWIVLAGLACAGVLCVVAAAWLFGHDAHTPGTGAEALFAEGGILEWVQFAAWLAAAAVSFAALARAGSLRDRLNSGWLGAIAVLAAARELDRQERLNPDVLSYGVSYRIDWWSDPGVPLPLKVAWAAVFAALAVALLAPPLLVRAPLFALLRLPDLGTWLFFMALGFLGVGYMIDDFLRVVREVGFGGHTRAAEESAEVVGCALFLATAALTFRRPITARSREATGSDAA